MLWTLQKWCPHPRETVPLLQQDALVQRWSAAFARISPGKQRSVSRCHPGASSGRPLGGPGPLLLDKLLLLIRPLLLNKQPLLLYPLRLRSLRQDFAQSSLRLSSYPRGLFRHNISPAAAVPTAICEDSVLTALTAAKLQSTEDVEQFSHVAPCTTG